LLLLLLLPPSSGGRWWSIADAVEEDEDADIYAMYRSACLAASLLTTSPSSTKAAQMPLDDVVAVS